MTFHERYRRMLWGAVGMWAITLVAGLVLVLGVGGDRQMVAASLVVFITIPAFMAGAMTAHAILLHKASQLERDTEESL